MAGAKVWWENKADDININLQPDSSALTAFKKKDWFWRLALTWKRCLFHVEIQILWYARWQLTPKEQLKNDD